MPLKYNEFFVKQNFSWIIIFLFVVSYFFLLPFTTKAQPGTQDVVYLKNGSVVNGVIIENVIGTHIKIQISGGSVFFYRYDEIEKMAKETIAAVESKPVVKSKKNSPEIPILPREKGITGNIATGLNVGENTNVSMLMTISYMFKFHYSIGVGMGIENVRSPLDNNQGSLTYLPVFLNIQYKPLKELVGPYIYAMGGYSSPSLDNNRNYTGGVLVEGGMGFYLYKSSNLSLRFGVGYRYQEDSFKYYSSWPVNQLVTGKDYYRRIAVRFGIAV